MFYFFGNDGHLHEHPDQQAGKKQFRLQLAQMAGRKRLPEDCDHLRQAFYGRNWRCKDCGATDSIQKR